MLQIMQTGLLQIQKAMSFSKWALEEVLTKVFVKHTQTTINNY